MCPRCNIETEFLGVNSLVKPFWQNLPHFFKYPLTKGGIAIMVGYGISSGLFTLMDNLGFLPIALIFSLAFLTLFFALLGYCNFLFHETLKGTLTPPHFGNLDCETFALSHFKQLLVWVLLNSIGGIIILNVSSPFNFALYEVCKVFLPALFILLLINNSLTVVINPLRLFAFIHKMGIKEYLLLYLFTSFLLSASDSIRLLIHKLHIEAPFVVSFITSTSQAYYLIILYHMLAYIVLQYHQKLGWEVNYAKFLKFNKKEILKNNQSVDPILNDARFLLGEAKPEEALKLIRKETHGEFTDPELALLCVKLLNQLGHSKQLKHIAGHIIELLLEKQKTNDAKNLYEQCIREIPNFQVSTSSIYNLAIHYDQAQEYPKALKTGIEFINRQPTHRKSPEMHIRLAQIASSNLNDTSLAIQIIKQFAARYKDHPLMEDAKKLFNQLKKQPVAPSKKQKEI